MYCHTGVKNRELCEEAIKVAAQIDEKTAKYVTASK